MTTVLALLVAVTPFVALAALLSLVSRRERTQQQAIAYQVAITDAIHGELGAVVAPVVTPVRRGRWRIGIPVPIGHPGLVAAILAIVDRRLVSRLGPDVRFEVLLTPRVEIRSPLPVEPARHGGPVPRRAHTRTEASGAWT
jgi:hypothetical protein